MKSILPLLLIYVMMTSQTFALSGGPVFGSGSAIVTGVYSGVIQGVTETSGDAQPPAIPGDPLPPVDNSATTASNAIGLFALSVPTTGLATGTFMVFADGVVFSGTINAAGDPDSGTLKGILEATYNFTLNTIDATGTVTGTQVTAQALGKINAQVRNNTSLFSASLARLIGTADLGINFGQVDASTLAPIVSRTITFDVIGFKQAQAAS